jgi:VirE N-terminal domain
MPDANSLAAAKVNLFRSSFESAPARTVTLTHALEMIRTGTYRRQVTHVRQILARDGKRTYDRAKAHLPALTFCGTFAPKRGLAHLKQHSGIIHGDLDHLPDVKAAKCTVCSDPRTVYCFDSPSGTGLKIGVNGPEVADDPEYKHVWQAVSMEYERLCGGEWDQSGKDISRLCYVSWDPEAYWNPNATVFELPPPPIHESPAPTSLQPSTTTYLIGCRDDYAVRAIRTAVQMIQAAVLGTRHHTRLKAARLLGGYVAGGLLTEEQAYAALAEALVGHTEDLDRALKTAEDGLRYGQACPITLDALEAERQAWVSAHRSKTQKVYGQRPLLGARYLVRGVHP